MINSPTGLFSHNHHSDGLMAGGLQGHISSHQRPAPIGPGRELLWWRIFLRLGFLNHPSPAVYGSKRLPTKVGHCLSATANKSPSY